MSLPTQLLFVIALGCVGCTTFGASPSGNADGGAGPGACTHTVCQDFDHGAPAAPWNVSNLGRTALLVSDQSSSSPNSLRATIGTDSAIPMVTVALAGAKHVRCGMHVELAQSSKTGGAHLLTLGTAAGDVVVVNILPGKTSVGDGTRADDFENLQPNQFVELALEVDAGTIKYTLGGITKNVGVPIKSDLVFTEADFGLYPLGSVAPWSVYLDDLYCDVVQ